MVVLITGLLYVVLLKFGQPVEINVQGLELLEPSPYGGDVKDFQIIAKRFASMHEYNRESYNCVNYSADLADLAESLGFDVQVVEGCKKGGGECHAWLKLEVDFEPQSAEFIDYSGLYPEDKK